MQVVVELHEAVSGAEEGLPTLRILSSPGSSLTEVETLSLSLSFAQLIRHKLQIASTCCGLCFHLVLKQLWFMVWLGSHGLWRTKSRGCSILYNYRINDIELCFIVVAGAPVPPVPHLNIHTIVYKKQYTYTIVAGELRPHLSHLSIVTQLLLLLLVLHSLIPIQEDDDDVDARRMITVPIVFLSQSQIKSWSLLES